MFIQHQMYHFEEQSLTVELIGRLVEALNTEKIVYCHWKSNLFLAQALSGEMDLDLLVDRRSLPKALTILTNLGFRHAIVKWGPGTPGVSHYYGFDPHTGQLVHVHLFSSVLTGESFVKSHLFSFEPMLLENADYFGQIRVASKAAELVLFVLRTFIKYSSPLDLMYLLRSSEDIRTELCWLQSGSDISEALYLLEKYCPVIDEAFFMECIDTLNGTSALVKRLMVAQRVRRRLRIYAKRTGFSRILAYVRWLWGQGQRRLGGKRKDKILKAGGSIIAFVGPEATGKSTLISECGRWLGSAFAVKTVHAGKPPSSWLTRPVNIVLPLVRSVLPRFRTTRLEGHHSSRSITQSQPKIEGLTSLIYGLRSLTLAWDRRQLLLKTRRLAASGEIVICDRYPSETIGAMDSPHLRKNPKGGIIAAVYNRLVRLEHRLYKQIPPPDIVLRLKVSIETAKRRNRERIKAGKETDTYVESRHRQSGEWHRSGTKYIYDINTEQPLAETILNVKKTIWRSL
jgi:thymidylate kinase